MLLNHSIGFNGTIGIGIGHNGEKMVPKSMLLATVAGCPLYYR
jgi:hypothetical protein